MPWPWERELKNLRRLNSANLVSSKDFRGQRREGETTDEPKEA